MKFWCVSCYIPFLYSSHCLKAPHSKRSLSSGQLHLAFRSADERGDRIASDPITRAHQSNDKTIGEEGLS